jgi:hypothetical protein
MAFTDSVYSITCVTCKQTRKLLIDNAMLAKVRANPPSECPQCFVVRKRAQKSMGKIDGFEAYLEGALR